jgi:putative MATE family efflux protein
MEVKETLSHSDLTVGSINSHLKHIAIPASIGFLFNTLFNVVDTIYAGRLSTEALAGLTISFPIFFIIIALSAGFGSAVTALNSIALGKKDIKLYHQISLNAILFGVIIGISTSIAAPYFSKPLFLLLGAEGDALALGVSYTNVIFFGATFFILNSILNGLLSSQGDTKTYRNFLIIGFFLNLLFDPLFIFGWFGLPKMGVVGVAFATILVQMIGTIYLFTRLSKSTHFEWKLLKLAHKSVKTVIDLLKQAIPASLNMVTIAIGIFIINYFVIKYGGTIGIAGYGAAVRIEQIALLPALGLNVAVLTITGQNYGAKQYERIREVMKKANLIGLLMMISAGIILFILAPFLVMIFNSDPLVIAVGSRYLRIETLALFTYVFLNVSTSILQGIKKPNYAIWIGVYRQVLPFGIFLLLGTTLKMGLDGVWWGIVVINWSAVIITYFYTQKQLKRLV